MYLSQGHIRKDCAFIFGDKSDGVIGIPFLTKEDYVGEASYFFGEKKPKNIIVISSQIGCAMKCSFCELGGVALKKSLSPEEMADQVLLVMEEARHRGFTLANTPHKITIANSGEPLLNSNIVQSLELLAGFDTSFKMSTVLPNNKVSASRLKEVAKFASGHKKSFQLQISLISTSEEERQKTAGAWVAGFREIREAAETWRTENPNGRKVNLSLILTAQMESEVSIMAALFPNELFRLRFREYVPTKNGGEHGHEAIPLERLRSIKGQFRDAGYEVTDDAAPTDTEKKFGLASNAIRRMYLDITGAAH